MKLTEDQQIVFEDNQSKDRVVLARLKSQGDFDGIDQIASITNLIGDHHFFKDEETRLDREIRLLGFEDAFDNFICRCTTLITSEVSELLEEARLENRDAEKMLFECTDIIIRSFNLATNLVRIGKEKNQLDKDASIGQFIHDKSAKNIERPMKHGSKRF